MASATEKMNCYFTKCYLNLNLNLKKQAWLLAAGLDNACLVDHCYKGDSREGHKVFLILLFSALLPFAV